jgi:hypothetical protein
VHDEVTFMDQWRAGRAEPDDIEDHMRRWHTNSGDRRSMHVALGMTWNEYRRWAYSGELPPAIPAGVAVGRPRVQLNTGRLWADVDDLRRRRGISQRELSRQAWHRTPSTISRLARGHTISVNELANLLTWMGDTDLAPYLADVDTADEAS